MASEELKIHDLFRLSNGVVLIACKKPTQDYDWSNRMVEIVSGSDGVSITVAISGRAELRSQSEHLDQIALETHADISLTSEDVQGSDWKLVP
jgi:hypothetical protein